MLVLVRKDGSATAYVNEIRLTGLMRSRRPLKAGEPVYVKDILDVERLKLSDITVPQDVGVLLLFSVRWRKGLYFDFGPLLPDGPGPRTYDLEKLCGQYYAYLLFQNLFKVTEEEWVALLSQRWFPFIYLGQPLVTKMLEYVRNGWNVDDLLPEFSAEIRTLLTADNAIWRDKPCLVEHAPLLERAAERYLREDFISVASILYPRIEGIMRSYHWQSGQTEDPTSKILTESVVAQGSERRHEHSFLLPDRFRQYLRDVYFASFQPGKPAPMSRTSVAHGVASATDFSEKAATIGWLTLCQIVLFAESPKPKEGETE
jgi:hypothetical protein